MDPEISLRRQFEALWAEHYLAVLAYAARRIGQADAGDIAADTFLVAWRRFEHAPDPGRVWLLAIARRVLANQVRGRKRQNALKAKIATSSVDQGVQPDPGSASEAEIAVGEAFNLLSAPDREVLALIAWDELRPREAAEVLGISAARFSVRLHRAKARMRKKVEAAGHSQVVEAAGDWPTPAPEAGPGERG
jgi:RNA polymerase sigma-70 factor (ECF subfamily)